MLHSIFSYFAPASVPSASSPSDESLSSPCVIVDAESLHGGGNGERSFNSGRLSGSGAEGELMATPYGVGRVLGYDSARAIVRVQLEWGLAFLHLSCLAPLQLVHCGQLGYAARNPASQRFEKMQPWGVAVIEPSASDVEEVWSYEVVSRRDVEEKENEEQEEASANRRCIRVSTPLGEGRLVGHARPDGLLAVDLEWGKLYTTVERLQIREEEGKRSCRAVSNKATASTSTCTASTCTQAQHTQTPASKQQQAETQTPLKSKGSVSLASVASASTDSGPSSASDRSRSSSPNSANSSDSSSGSGGDRKSSGKSSKSAKSGASVAKQRFRPKGRK